MKDTALPPLRSPAADHRDALKKQYAGGGEGGKPLAAIAVPRPSIGERLQRLREAWLFYQSSQAKDPFEEMPDAETTRRITKFEEERLGGLASPIANAWRRDGVKSRIAASTFYRRLAASMWPGDVSDRQLLEFAMSRVP